MINKMKQFASNVLDRSADLVQGMTGEKERREQVDRLKRLYDIYRSDISLLIEKINRTVNRFNNRIEELNKVRETKIKRNVAYLGMFLSQFGNINSVKDFTAEEQQNQIELPHKKFEAIDDYIEKIDWSKGDVFAKTFFKTMLGVTVETRNKNKKTAQRIEEFTIEGNQMLENSKLKLRFVEEDIQIIDMYQKSVESISDTIESKVMPELELIQAFLQCETLKNQLIANQELSVTTVTDPGLLATSRYQKHYKFVKNALFFFVISSRIYNTPVLTNLLTNEKHEKEREAVSNYRRIVTKQREKIEQYRIG
ncbi:hypothetical protein [Paenibacillus amylolyticus]|uniref:Uncharacterized protein n=1 Tax=Paenibacillus amylolyticus TaxID=1451 RepID=A0ABD8B2X8_PAEAM